MTCEHCGQFWSPGQNQGVINGGGCPNCGERPYMNQPNPVESEMTLRDMPSIDMPFQEDQGGNPMLEGILRPTSKDLVGWFLP